MYDMGVFVIAHQKLFDTITGNIKLGLREFGVWEREWKLFSDIISVLGLFKEATLYFSCSNALVLQVIVAINELDHHLNPKTQSKLDPVVIQALSLGRQKLHHFYANTDSSIVFCASKGMCTIISHWHEY